jgi:hypothetical protein
MHLVQIGVGLLEISAGMTTAPTGVGILLVAHGFDQVTNGVFSVMSQKDYETLTAHSIGRGAGLVMSEEKARAVGQVGDALVGVLLLSGPRRPMAPRGAPLLQAEGGFANGIGMNLGPRAAATTCFVAGTPLLTPDGEKRIEEFRPGDLILSRAEGNLRSPIVARQVEELFVRVAPIFEIRIGERIIQTTREHPFYVDGAGWTIAGELKPGDLLCSHDGATVRIDSVGDTGQVRTVYNLRVAEDHTYFVGTRAWGFSVWAHNAPTTAYIPIVDAQGRLTMVIDGFTGRTISAERLAGLQREGIQEAIAQARLPAINTAGRGNLGLDEIRRIASEYAVASNRNQAVNWRTIAGSLTEEQQAIIQSYAHNAGFVAAAERGTVAPATTTPANSPLLRRYLSESGGRWGGTATRQLNHRLATDLETRGFRVTGGAGRGPEEWIRGPGGGARGGSWVDITATNGTQTTRIQTVTTLADGVTPTASEAAAAARIRAQFPNDTLILVSKQTGQVIP